MDGWLFRAAVKCILVGMILMSISGDKMWRGHPSFSPSAPFLHSYVDLVVVVLHLGALPSQTRRLVSSWTHSAAAMSLAAKWGCQPKLHHSPQKSLILHRNHINSFSQSYKITWQSSKPSLKYNTHPKMPWENLAPFSYIQHPPPNVTYQPRPHPPQTYHSTADRSGRWWLSP